MQISSSAYLGVETLLRLAAKPASGPCTARSLAACIKRSVSYTETLMAQLRAAGLVASRRGPGGGYILAKPVDRITIAEVFAAVEAPSDHANYLHLGDTGSAADIHDLHGTPLLWEALRGHVLLLLSGVSLADLIPEAMPLTGRSSEAKQAYALSVTSTAQH